MVLVRALIRVVAQSLLYFDEARGNRRGQFEDGFVAAGCAFLGEETQAHPPRKGDRPRIRGDFAKDERKERRLARPVGSDQANAISGIDLQRRVLEKDTSGVGFGEL